jgi:hypothetical protein
VAMTTPMALSWEVAVAWTVALAVAGSIGVTPAVVEATTTTSMAGEFAMSKIWVEVGHVVARSDRSRTRMM